MPADASTAAPLVRVVKVHYELQQADMAHICDLLAAYAKAKDGHPPLIADLAADIMRLTPKEDNCLAAWFDSFESQHIADLVKCVAAGDKGPLALSQGLKNAGLLASSISTYSKLRAAGDVALAKPKASGGPYWTFNVDCVPQELADGKPVWCVYEVMVKHFKGLEYLEANAQLEQILLSLVIVANSKL